MALQIEQRDRQDILILALIGHLTMGPEDAEFRTVVQNCIANGKINIMLDCSRLGKIDTVGLGSLVYCQIKARRAGGKIVLANISRTHMLLLASAKLESVFDVFTDEQDAVNSFFPDRVIKPFDILEFVREETHREEASAGGPTPDAG